MTHSRKEKLTEADIAYEILKANGKPMHYRDLIKEVLLRLGISQDAIRMAAALTQINLDTRFYFLGRGEWGLRAWEPTKIPKRVAPISLANKASFDEEEKFDTDEFDEEILDEDALDMDEVFDEADEAQGEEKW